jgi:hypothetical protein
VSDIVAVFTPEENDGSWALHVVFDHPAFRLPGLDSGERVTGLGRPNLDDLNTRMLNANAGFVVRVQPSGAIEVSASDRSAVVLHDWLQSIIRNGSGE